MSLGQSASVLHDGAHTVPLGTVAHTQLGEGPHLPLHSVSVLQPLKGPPPDDPLAPEDPLPEDPLPEDPPPEDPPPEEDPLPDDEPLLVEDAAPLLEPLLPVSAVAPASVLAPVSKTAPLSWAAPASPDELPPDDPLDAAPLSCLPPSSLDGISA